MASATHASALDSLQAPQNNSSTSRAWRHWLDSRGVILLELGETGSGAWVPHSDYGGKKVVLSRI